MQKILSEQSVTDATAGTLVVNSVKGKAAESSVGWLAIARAGMLDIRLEVGPSRSRDDPSRDLEVVQKIELDGHPSALAACPRCSGRGDDLLIALDTLSWELVRLHATVLPRKSDMEGRYIRIDTSVVASGLFRSNPRHNFDTVCRAATPKMAIHLDVLGPSLDMGASEEQVRCRNQHGGVKTLVACTCGSAITLLTFFHDTPDGQDRSRSGDSSVLTSTSTTFPLTPDVCGTTFPLTPDVRGIRSTIERSRGPRNHHDQPAGRQSHASVNDIKRQAIPPLRTLSGASAIQDLVIISGERYERVEATAGGAYSPERDAYSPVIIAVLLVDEGRGDRGGDAPRRDWNIGGRRPKLVRTFRWDLSRGGGGTLIPGHWCLANLHPDTCITSLATGGLLCVDPHGVKAFTEDGVPLLGMRRNARGRGVGTSIPCTRGSWRPNARPVAITRFDRESRRQELNRQRFFGGKGHSDVREDFLLADISGNLHCVSVFISSSVRTSSDGNCPEGEGTNNRYGFSRSSCTRIECTNQALSFGDVPCRLHHHLQVLLPVGSRDLVFAMTPSSPFPVVVRIPFAPHPPNMLPTGVGERIRRVEDDRVQATTELAAHTASWQLLEGWEERLAGPSLGSVSGMIVLPGLRNDEQEITWFDRTADGSSGKVKTPAHTQPGHVIGSSLEEGERHSLPGTRKRERPCGLRVALATGTVCPSDASTRKVGGANDPANSLGIFEHGVRLETIAEGSVGLPAGATLFAQPIPVGHADSPEGHRYRRPIQEKRGRNTSGQQDKDKECIDGGGDTGHVMVLSDRVRSRTDVMFKSPSGEVAPAKTEATKGFDCGQHTIHLGRLEPLGYIVQVTPDSVNIVRSSAWSEVAESVASWRPLPPSSSCSPFKVQHAGTAGTVVAVVCESTMVLIEVRDAAPAAVEVTNRAKRTVDDDGTPKSAISHTMTAREVRRVELDGGPTSAMCMRSCAENKPKEGTSTGAAPVLIAASSWDSPAITVCSFSARPTANSVHSQTTLPRVPQTRDELCDSIALLNNVATWHPPWGGSVLPPVTSDSSDGGAGTGTAVKAAVPRRDISATLTRALALVQFKDEPERMSVVAATAGGAVAVGEWQQGRSAEEDGHDNRYASGGLTGRQQTTVRNSSRVALVTIASFQVGQGPVRLVMFRATGLVEGADSSGDGGGVEQVIVNGDMMDAVVHRCTEAPALDHSLGGWRCTQVCRTGRHRRESLVHLPQGAMDMPSGRSTKNNFAWLVTKESARRHRDPPDYFDIKRHHDDVGDDINTEIHVGASRDAEPPRRELSLSFGTLHGLEPWGGLCRKTPLQWAPTHLVYVPITRSIVVAFQTSSEEDVSNRNITTATASGTITAASPHARSTKQEMRPSPPSFLPSSSTLRIYDADTLEERPGTAPLRLLPGVRVTGMSLLPGLPSIIRGTAATSTAVSAAKVMRGVYGSGRSLAMPAEAAAIGGDVIAVACCSLTNAGSSKVVKDGESTGDGGSGRHDDETDRTLEGERFGRSDKVLSRNTPTTSSTAVSDEPAPSFGKAAGTVTVLSAFEVVAFGSDGAVAADDTGHEIRATPHCKTQDVGGGADQLPRRGPDVSNDFDSHTSMALTALAASPEMVGACFSVEALGKRSVAVSNDDRVLVFGWEGHEGGLRSDELVPPLKLTIQVRCRTPGGRCVTALATCEKFVAVAEFLHCVCLYRFDEARRELSLVAKHSRGSLIVTALELSIRPVFPSSYGAEEGNGESMVPLLAVADLTTKTVAVLACPCVAHSSSATDIGGSTKIPPTNASTSGRNICRGGGISGGDRPNDVTSSFSESADANSGNEGASRRRADAAPRTTGVGSQDPDVALLGLVSVWPCHDKVTTLASEPTLPPDDDSDDVYLGGDHQGKQRQRRQRKHQQHGDNAKYPPHISACWRFLAGTASGAVLAGRVSVPHGSPVLKTSE